MFPSKVGSTWTIDSPAKLNLYLNIINRQKSGYHALETLMVTIRLADTLSWLPESSQGFRLRVIQRVCQAQTNSNRHAHSATRLQQNVLADSSNLVLQAAQLLAQRAGIKPYGTFTLNKRIPTCAGLGGGSSNAAATLLLINTAWKIGCSSTQLMEMAAALGSDVPYFIATQQPGTAAICRGRGEQVETINAMGCLHFVLIKPARGISTKELFAQVDIQAIRSQRESTSVLPQLIDALRRGNLAIACELISNDLEAIALANHPWLRQLCNELKQHSRCGHWMTGSGSTYVCLVRTAKQAQHIASTLRARQLGEVFTTMSC
jgi:4-diphosphocytidyl-2-C-methyl-D-erythritol kinase